MKAVRKLNNNRGFSLIELMIVVAIIGILATIAVPNFTRFQNKAKQSEAKTNLSAIYMAHKAFFAEWGSYYGIFADIGYVPEGRINYLLSTGGAGTAPTGLTAATGNGSGASCHNTLAACASLPITRSGSHPAAVPAGGSIAAPTASPTFTAVAGAQLNSGAATIDTWTMNQDKTLNNTVNGL